MREVRAPQRAVDRRPGDAVEAERDARVLAVVGRPARLAIAFVALAVAVGIDDQRGPALRLRGVAGLEIHLGVEPADHGQIVLAVVGEPKRVVGVLGEVEVMRAEAGIDVRPLLRLRIVERELPAALRDRHHLRRRMVRPLDAEVGVLGRAEARAS